MTDFFEDLERQLEQAGKRLAKPARKRERRFLAPPAIIVGLVLLLGGVSTAAVVRDSPRERFERLQRLMKQDEAERRADPYVDARAYGVDASSARKVFEGAGRVFSVARSDDAACLLVATRAGPQYASCSTIDQIAAGHGLQVQVDCGTIKARRPMMVRGLLPREVAELRVGYSDESVKRAKVVRGAVLLEAETPTAGKPYPTSEVWVGSDGRVLRRAQFPFDGRKLCIPVPSRESTRRG